MKKILTIVCLLIYVIVPAQTYTWNQVKIGGGGNVPTFIAHPKVPDLYFITTDVGSPYRWNKDLQKWEPIMLFESMPVNYWMWDWNQRCGSLAVDPNDVTGNILYAAVQNGEGAGPGQGKDWMGTVMKSTDRGNSWTDCRVPFYLNPNGTQTFGDRIQVDPQNSNIVWLVTDQHGAFKTENAGGSFTAVNNGIGTTRCTFIVFDVSSGTVQVNGKAVTKRIYIGKDNGVLVTEDGGQSFTLIPNSPTQTTRATIHTDGTMYIAAGYNNQKRSVFKYKNGVWQDISPVNLGPGGDVRFAKVAVNPANSNEIVVGTTGSWNKDPYYVSNQGGAPGFYSISKITRDRSEAPQSPNDGVAYGSPAHNAGAYTWDPFHAGKIWVNDMFDVLSTENVFAEVANWKIRVNGLEEVMVTGPMVAPPSGRNLLLSVTADVGGASHRSLTAPLTSGAVSYTSINSNINSALNTQGVAFQYTDPEFIVRIGTDGADGNEPYRLRSGYSVNGGDQFTLFSQSPGIRGRVAVSANKRTILWLTQNDFGGYAGDVWRSDNLGSSWTKSAGAPKGILPSGGQWLVFEGENHLVADKANGDYFYIWDRGSFYVSSDDGRSFQKTAATGLNANNYHNPNTNSAYGTTSNIEVTPGKTGDVWIAFQGSDYNASGLYHTTDTGKTFTKVGGADFKPLYIAAAMSDTTPNAHLALYVTSANYPINGIVFGAFRSDDTGRTWQTISNRIPGVAANITADNRGRLFLGVSGNGLFYATPVAGPVQAVEIIKTGSDTIVQGYTTKLSVKLTPAYPTNPGVVWSSSDTNIAKVNNYGTVTGINPGIATITVASVDGSNKTDTHIITVIPPMVSTGIVIDSVVYGTLGTPQQIIYSITPANVTNKTINWTVGNTTIASVNSNGIVTGLQPGNTTITATTADGGATITVPLRINTIIKGFNSGSNSRHGQYFKEDSASTLLNWTAGYTWTGSTSAAIDRSQVTEPAPAQVYSSFRVSKVNGTPLRYYFRSLIPGASYTVRIHFMEPDNNDKANHVFSVRSPGSTDTSITNFNIYQAAGNKLYTVVTRNISVKANASGVAEVYFYPKVANPDIYSVFVSAIEIRINPLQAINIVSDSTNISVNHTDTLKVVTTPVNATNNKVVYTSSNNSIAIVDVNGVVKGVSPGTATVTATSVEGGFVATKTFTVIYTPVSGVTINTADTTVKVGDTIKLTSTVLPANASNKQVIWTSSDSTIAKVNSAGSVIGIKAGDVVINATSAENAVKFAQANVHVSNVLTTALTLSPSSAIIGEKDSLKVMAWFSPANTSIQTLTWTSSDAAVATVNANGLINAVKQGAATITATTQDGSGISATFPVIIVPYDSCGGIRNNGFESGFINWLRFNNGSPTTSAVYTVSGQGHTGNKAVTLGYATVNTSLNIKDSVPVRGSSVIVFSYWVKIESAGGDWPWWAGYKVGFVTSTGAAITTNVPAQKDIQSVSAYRGQWAQIRDTITVPDNATGLTYWIAKAGPGTVWVDDYCIELLKTNKNVITGINVGTYQNNTSQPQTPYVNTTFAQYVPEGQSGTDKLWHAGYTWIGHITAPIDMSYATDPAPKEVYEYVRVSKVNVTPLRYYFRNLTPYTFYTVRLHFVEADNNDKMNRIFNVKATNGIDSLIDFIPYVAAGNRLYTVVIRSIRAMADANGKIEVYFYPKTGTYDPYSACLSAIELRNLEGSIPGETVARVGQGANGTDTKMNNVLKLSANVYPNPSNSGFNVNITSSSNAPAWLTIVDNTGRLLYSAKVNVGQHYVVGEKLKTGMYHLKVQQGAESRIIKVVKQ